MVHQHKINHSVPLFSKSPVWWVLLGFGFWG